jgi:4-amino-4-deoxy-L-arabinose transferase-like glycosyltransferase
MSNITLKLSRPSKVLTGTLLAIILLIALFLRTFQLDQFPRGPFEDEAAATIIASEITLGRYLPIFVTSFTGHEVLFYYLAVIVMRLLGTTVFALRLTSAVAGTVTVLLAYRLARELFDDDPTVESHWLGLFAAALMATSFWHISISRYGYRAITLPLMQSLMLLALWRGLRRPSWKWILAAGAFCGLVAYTYLSSRIMPVALAILFALMLISERTRWRQRLAQMSVMTLVALVVFAPLGIFFVTHPETFGVRMTQVSAFSTGEAWQTALLHNTLRALEVFTLRGDPQWRFNLPDMPMFQGPLAFAFYAGLIVIVVRWVRSNGFLGRVRYALLVIWPLVMMVPTILADPTYNPHSLRAIGVLPLAFFIPALGLWAIWGLIQRALRATNARWMPVITAALLILVAGGNAAGTFQSYFVRWGPEPRLYYELDQDVADMARYVGSLPDDGRTIYVSAVDYRHPTVAALARNYDRLKWMQGGDLFVFSPGPATYAWPHSSTPDSFWMAPFFPPESRVSQKLGPDGQVAYAIYALEHPPVISPAHPLSVTFGGIIEAIGYDVLRDRPSGGRTDVAMYWRILRKPDRGDYSEFARLNDAWGIQRGEGGSFAYPSEQWAPGEIIAERVRVQTEDGTPPGQYVLKLGWWSASTGQQLSALNAEGGFAGTTITIGPITVTRRIRPFSLNTVNISHHLNTDFGELKLLGFDQWPASIRQGEPEFVTLYWQAQSGSLPDHQVTFQLRGKDQQVSLLLHSGLVHGTYSTSQWAAGEFIADRLALRVPPDTPPGDYVLEAVVDDRSAQPLGRFMVEAITRNGAPPAISHPMSVTFGSQIALAGYNLEPASGAQSLGQPLQLTLIWKSLAPADANYTVFVHLVDADGRVRAQKDNAPVNNTYPTTLWQPGEFVADTYSIVLPADFPPGDYGLEVGLYLAETGTRLATLDNSDHVVLGQVSITP